jgi:hypothetical protein
MITTVWGAPQEFEPYGRRLLPLHPKKLGLFQTNNMSLWTSAETDTSRDLFRALKAVTIQDNSPVIIIVIIYLLI